MTDLEMCSRSYLVAVDHNKSWDKMREGVAGGGKKLEEMLEITTPVQATKDL